MAQAQSLNFQALLDQLLQQEVGRFVMAAMTPSSLAQAAAGLTARDVHRYPSFLQALSPHLAPDISSEEFARMHLEHMLWLQHRRALWLTGRVTPLETGCSLDIQNEEHLRATSDLPTVIISPMVLAYEDVLWIAQSLFRPRELAVYGEGLTEGGIFSTVQRCFSLDSVRLVQSAKQIIAVLKRKGVFLTYPDFAYAGHKTCTTTFLGLNWPFSSSFIGICSQPDTMLLPCSVLRKGNDIVIGFETPVQIVLPKGVPSDRRWSQHLVAAVVARLLENLILKNPAQWQLVPTIAADCVQRGAA